LLAAVSNFAYLDDQTKKDTAPWMDFYVYDRAKFSPLTGELALGAKAIYALLPLSLAGAAPGNISISASLIDTTSGTNLSIPLAPLSKARKGNIELQLAELAVEGIAAGKYILYIRAEEAGKKAVAYAQVPISIRQP
jgi:hypothetical protein